MSLWWRPAAEPKNKRPPLAVFYSILFCQYHRFCYPSPHTARKGACEGGTFAGFPPSRSITRPQAITFAPQKCRTSKKETSKRMSLFCWCERWDLNPHDLTDTSTSSLPVCRFQHARERSLRYYNKIPPFVKRQPEKLPESFAVRPVAQAYKNSFFQGKEKTLEALRLQGFSCCDCPQVLLSRDQFFLPCFLADISVKPCVSGILFLLNTSNSTRLKFGLHCTFLTSREM